MNTLKIKILTTLLCFMSHVWAQKPAYYNQLGNDPLKVAITFNYCDKYAFASETKYIELVNNEDEAQVIIDAITEKKDDKSGTLTLYFRGGKNFVGLNDSVIYETSGTAPRSVQCNELTKLMEFGLLRYVMRTKLQSDITVYHKLAKKRNRYNFTDNLVLLEVDGNVRGEEHFKSIESQTMFTWQQLTELTVRELSANLNYRNYNYKFAFDSTSFQTSLHTARVGYFYRKQLDDNWAGGMRATAASSKFENLKWRGSIAPYIEIYVFSPWDQTRRLSIVYDVNFSFNKFYYTPVIARGFMARQQLAVLSVTNRDWGSFIFSVRAGNLFHDYGSNYTEVWSRVNFNISKRLQFFILGSYTSMNDLAIVPQKSANKNQELMRELLQDTDFLYTFRFGLSFKAKTVQEPFTFPHHGCFGRVFPY